MSDDGDGDGDPEETPEPDGETGEETAVERKVTVESLRERLAAIEERLDEADTEADLDDVAADVEDLEADLDDADLDDDAVEESDEDTTAEDVLEEEVETVREELEEQRGPYAADVADRLETTADAVADTRWTDDGRSALREALGTFLAAATDALGERFTPGGEAPDAVAADVETVADAVRSADLDPDDDAETVAELLAAAEDLQGAVEDAQSFDDLSVRGKLREEGFYDVLDHRKDFPPEWSALKVHEQEGNVEMILLAMDLLDSEFMVGHCLEALERLGPEQALEAMQTKAKRRDKPAIRVLGTIASDEPLDMLTEYAASDGDPQLQMVSLQALGEIGSREATQAVADRLASDDADVRSRAARSLGLIGDTRAIEPLADVLAEDDADRVRASAAWALRQIGTERALREVRQYADDRAYLVQAEAERAV